MIKDKSIVFLYRIVHFFKKKFFQQPPLVPHELRNSFNHSSRLNPQMCPWNPNLVAYINNGDIWVHNILLSKDTRLTYVKKGKYFLFKREIFILCNFLFRS